MYVFYGNVDGRSSPCHRALYRLSNNKLAAFQQQVNVGPTSKSARGSILDIDASRIQIAYRWTGIPITYIRRRLETNAHCTCTCITKQAYFLNPLNFDNIRSPKLQA